MIKKFFVFSSLISLMLVNNLSQAEVSHDDLIHDNALIFQGQPQQPNSEPVYPVREFSTNESSENLKRNNSVAQPNPNDAKAKKAIKNSSSSLQIEESEESAVAAQVADSLPEHNLNILYRGNTRYYVTPSGKAILDKRRVGSIYPNLFNVVRTNSMGSSYVETEDEDNGCNLEKLFLSNIYKPYGFDVRRYLNALATSENMCSKLNSAAEQNLCKQYHQNPACSGATPIVFEALPLPPGQTYLTYKRAPFNCSAASDQILKYTYVPKQATEWAKIESDLVEKRRSQYMNELRAQAPVAQIKQAKSGASKREIDFAINDWAFNEAKKKDIQISDSEIQPIAERRYSPSAAMRNMLEFKSETGGVCKGKESRYNSKAYAEGMNIPPHEVLAFSDFMDTANGCICKK